MPLKWETNQRCRQCLFFFSSFNSSSLSFCLFFSVFLSSTFLFSLMGNGGVERLFSGKKLLFLIFSATDEGGWKGEGLVIIFFQEMFIGERVINDSTGIIKVRTLYSTTSSSPSLSFEVPPDYSEQSSPPTSDSAQSPSSPPYQKFAAITSCHNQKVSISKVASF